MQPALPYAMPASPRGKIDYLSRLMSLKPAAVAGLPELQAAALLSDVVLYPHLGRIEKEQVMRKIIVLPGQQRQALTEKVLAPIVSPYWGIWAMPTAELFRHHEFFDTIGTAGANIGITFSATAGVDALRSLQKNGSLAARGFAVSVAIWGFFWLNDKTKGVIQEEIFRRAGKAA